MLLHLGNRQLISSNRGQVAICSAHPQVLMAAANAARRYGDILLVEATGNQVNISGGYTGMTPADFAGYLARLAADSGLARDQIVMGADHLGPHLWPQLPAAEAMAKAEVLTKAFVAAGYRKLHLDTGRGCMDDPQGCLPVQVAAQRAAALGRAAESAAVHFRMEPPVYTIGTEVPAPGGSLGPDGSIAVTDPQCLQAELQHYKNAFHRAGIDQAWERILAVVVQPGVDFDDFRAAAYRPEAATALSALHDQLSGDMTFEIHAADYQSPSALKQMVRDHFALLKIGPCLTFALRETIFALAQIENALPVLKHRSRLMSVMEELMLAHPRHWDGYYRGTEQELRHLRRFSLRDRIRYYWPRSEARRACELLFNNLRRPIPPSLIGQYLPDLDDAIASGALTPTPQAIIQARIQSALRPYTEACRTQTVNP